MKVHILGGPGSGKTTLAAAIASRWQLPHHDLDRLSQQHGADLPACFQETQAILHQPGWVSEGIYLLFTDLLLEQADAIALLDVSWPAAAARITRRHIAKTLNGTNPYPGLRLLYLLLKYARGYYTNRRPSSAAAVASYFAEYDGAAPPTSASVLSKLGKYPSLVIPPTAAFTRRYLEPYREKVVVIRGSEDQKRLLSRLGNWEHPIP